VWVVGERINSGRSLTSFEHAFIGREVGWIVHDVMIYQKKHTPFMRSNAYTNCYELLIVFSNGKPKTFNSLKEPTKRNGWETAVFGKGPDAVNRRRPVLLKKTKTRTNIWQYAVGCGGTTTDKIGLTIPPYSRKSWRKTIHYLGQTRGIWSLIQGVEAAPHAREILLVK